MKQHLIQIRAENQPSTLEQLLRVVRFRGFEVDKVSMNIESENSEMDIAVEVKSKRPIHLLENQLRKLVPIREVMVASQQLMPRTTVQAAAHG